MNNQNPNIQSNQNTENEKDDGGEVFIICGIAVKLRPGLLGVVDKATAIARAQMDNSWKKNNCFVAAKKND